MSEASSDWLSSASLPALLVIEARRLLAERLATMGVADGSRWWHRLEVQREDEPRTTQS